MNKARLAKCDVYSLAPIACVIIGISLITTIYRFITLLDVWKHLPNEKPPAEWYWQEQ